MSTEIPPLPSPPHTAPSSSSAPDLSRSFSSILECSLCLSLVCEPISISCGHTFCRVCLVKSLRRHKKRCPTCREICHITPETAPENIMIKAMAMTIDADGYRSRLEETSSEKATWSTVYPVFYYNTAMFPGSRLSLHLFEPRYKIMMQRVVNSTKAFAYVPNFTNYHAEAGDIALVAKLKEVEFLPDGRCLLESVLAGRHRIVDHYVEDGTQGLHFCRLEAVQDGPLDAESSERAKALAQRGLELAKFIIETTTSVNAVERQFGPMPSTEGLEEFSLWLAALCPLPERDKAAMLLTTSTLTRLQKCVDGLTAYVSHINTRKQAAAVFSAAGSTVTSASSTLGSIISALLGRRPSQDESDATQREEEEEVAMEEEEGEDDGGGDMQEEEVEEEEEVGDHEGDGDRSA